MKILAFCAILALVSSCNSNSVPVVSVSEQDIHQDHQQILALQKYLTTQHPVVDQLVAIKLADIAEESTGVINELGKLNNKQESERLGTANVLAIKESILLLAAQQIPKHARFTAKY